MGARGYVLDASLSPWSAVLLAALLVFGVVAALAAGITWNMVEMGWRWMALSVGLLGAFGLLLWLLGPSLGLAP